MIKMLIARFIDNYDHTEDNRIRAKYIKLSGILGILCNLLLFGLKLAIGLLMNSIAIISDAFNNLSDMGSSIITLVAAKRSNHLPDRDHPFGHGRLEYISKLVISFIIIVVGFELLQNSLGKIINPTPILFSTVLIIIFSLSILLKIWMYSYNQYISKKIKSGINQATAADSLNDALITAGIVIVMLASRYLDFTIDGYIGMIIAAFIMYSGFKITRATVNILVGTSPDPELVEKITALVMRNGYIAKINDLIVHDYGPGRIMASLRAEVRENTSISENHSVIDELEKDILRELGIEIIIHADPAFNDHKNDL
jgi:cation diffusion facilitator family transporter